MTAKEVVREVICLLKGGKKWGKGAYMRTADNRHLYASNPQTKQAAKFCLLGAAHRVLGLTEFASSHPVIREFSELVRDSLPKAKLDQIKTSSYVTKNYDVEANAYVDDPGGYVVGFNDGGSTSFEEIERVLARALVRKPRRTKKAKQPTA